METARDAATIAEAARTTPHTLRTIALDDETLAELGVLYGFDDDLAGQITATSNRIRGSTSEVTSAATSAAWKPSPAAAPSDARLDERAFPHATRGIPHLVTAELGPRAGVLDPADFARLSAVPGLPLTAVSARLCPLPGIP